MSITLYPSQTLAQKDGRKQKRYTSVFLSYKKGDENASVQNQKRPHAFASKFKVLKILIHIYIQFTNPLAQCLIQFDSSF